MKRKNGSSTVHSTFFSESKRGTHSELISESFFIFHGDLRTVFSIFTPTLSFQTKREGGEKEEREGKKQNYKCTIYRLTILSDGREAVTGRIRTGGWVGGRGGIERAIDRVQRRARWRRVAAPAVLTPLPPPHRSTRRGIPSSLIPIPNNLSED